MRALTPEQGGPRGIWQQHFIDHFFYEADELMANRYKVNNARKTGFMKDLYEQYRGMTAGFDEGLIGSDAVLATAIWR